MEHSIIDLIYGREEMINEAVEANKAYREVSEYALNLYDKLCRSMTKQQKEDFEKFLDNESEQEDIKVKTAFIYGFKYGVRLVAESMFD